MNVCKDTISDGHIEPGEAIESSWPPIMAIHLELTMFHSQVLNGNTANHSQAVPKHYRAPPLLDSHTIYYQHSVWVK